MKSRFLLLVVATLRFYSVPLPAAETQWESLFSLPGEKSILDEAHLGIVNGKLTLGVPYKDVAQIDGLWAPPFVSSDFSLSVSIAGQKTPTERYVWWPFKVERKATVAGVRVSTATVLIAGKRAGLLTINLRNSSSQRREVPLEVQARGSLDRVDFWEFAAPRSNTSTVPAVEGKRLVLGQRKLAVVLEATGEHFQWDQAGRSGRSLCTLAPGASETFCLAFAVGEKSEAVSACEAIAADPAKAVRDAEAEHRRQVREMFQKLPRLESSNEALVKFYQRSLVHFLMNRWDVPEFVLRPYYGTGSVKGGCVCNYLWNFGETWEILPLVDPAAARSHVVQFLKTDLTRHFAFNPVDGKAFGPWYMVNQEKILGLVYYYVKNTGDVAFLDMKVDGKTIFEHVLAHATFGDDLAKPVALIDYGPSNSHLELRRGYPYHHVMPDLNGRRYANYVMAWRLAKVAGKSSPDLLGRAEALKSLLKRELWNPATRWFDFRDARGKDSRYTVQMFKLFGSRVLDAEEEAGLLSHLNEREFLSQYGLHSLAKTDIAYDQVDIDNGGGGSCTCFPPQIAERLYKCNHPQAAEDVLRRILWWGERMPYWGDSLVANQLDYRKDTPLQCTIDGVTVAQCILFGLFGIDADFDGTIRIRPRPADFAPQRTLLGVKLRGQAFDVRVQGDQFEVRTANGTVQAKLGQCIVLGKEGLSLDSQGGKTPPAEF